MRGPWEAHAPRRPKAALLTPPGAGQAPASPSIPCHLLISWAHPGQRTAARRSMSRELGSGPGRFRRRNPLPSTPRASARSGSTFQGTPQRAQIRFAGSRPRIRAKARARGRRNPSPDSARTPLMPPERMRGGRSGGNRNRDLGVIILLIKSRLLHKGPTRYPHAGTTEKPEIRPGTRQRSGRIFRRKRSAFRAASIDLTLARGLRVLEPTPRRMIE